nr:hypothetical protein [Klebsiella pneumoniae]
MYSPPTAGVIGANRKSGCLKNGIPPAYGGYRHEPAHSDAHLLYSPRMRGLSVRLLTEKLGLCSYSPTQGYRPTRCPGELAE